MPGESMPGESTRSDRRALAADESPLAWRRPLSAHAPDEARRCDLDGACGGDGAREAPAAATPAGGASFRFGGWLSALLHSNAAFFVGCALGVFGIAVGVPRFARVSKTPLGVDTGTSAKDAASIARSAEYALRLREWKALERHFNEVRLKEKGDIWDAAKVVGTRNAERDEARPADERNEARHDKRDSEESDDDDLDVYAEKLDAFFAVPGSAVPPGSPAAAGSAAAAAVPAAADSPAAAPFPAAAPEPDECPICLDAARDAALVPCGHRCCSNCARDLQKKKGYCFFCRAKIQAILRTWD
ncbi:hypothetical protein M885DRAFT_560096 [Pelagophyceae sp. CCMP2097]|nr:hypothetical protein M885DRAFT_560096 [Pelagophyceae sp. CCMP2097]